MDFEKTRKVQQDYFAPSAVDKLILQDTAMHYRVMNLDNPFNDAVTSYHHKSIGGYHGAKLQRYQDLIDFHLSKMNMDVFNMLNAKYFIVPNRETGERQVQPNTKALGNAWFVQHVRFVPNPDAEIEALNSFNPSETAVVDTRFKDDITDSSFILEASANIELTSYAPDRLTYSSSNKHKGLAVFSEVFYDKGWNTYIDGELTPHIRANYILRTLEIPAGNHHIEFKFEPKAFYVTNNISLYSSIVLILVLILIFAQEIRICIQERKKISK
jgi:hypothetical protein